MFKLSKAKAGVAALGAVGICATAMGSASADIYPQVNDVVGSGSDTTQFTTNFIMDGTTGGFPGYNLGKTNRVFSFDASADADGRGVFPPSSTTLLAATSVMRAGTKPVIRPNGSGAGIKSLYQAPYIGVSGAPVVQFARASRLPTCAENLQAVNAGYGGLHVYKFANDDLTMGTTPATNAPAGLTTQQVIDIYEGDILTWNQIPGNGGGSGGTIIPLIPQPGSGTRGSFDAFLKAANGGVTVVFANPNQKVTQESDWAAYEPGNTPSPNNTIGPFSSGRVALNDTGFLGPDAANKVVLRRGTPPGGGVAYNDERQMSFVVRESDVTSPTIFQPGGTRNWVRTLFAGSTSVVASAAFSGNIQAAGMTPAYQDLGVGQAGVSCTN